MNPDPSPSPHRAPDRLGGRIRPNRRRWSLLLVQFYVILQVFMIAPMLNAGEDFSLGRVLGGSICGAITMVAMFAMTVRSAYFEYDLDSGFIRVRKGPWAWRSYPRPGYQRLEFSFVYGEIHEVAADGKRRKLPVTAVWANRDDWKAFVEGFHPDAGLPIAIRRVPQARSGSARTAQPPNEGRPR